ncbi:MAG TPA: hypothetical protein VGN14_18695, partial [Candidatus Elarobacter sp.]
MFGARPSVALALACALLPVAPRPVAAAASVPLDYKAYDGWSVPRTPRVSDDGKSFAYALTPEDGDPTLVVRDLDSGAERREVRGSAPRFAADGRFVVFTHVAAKKDVDAAKKAKKPESQQPKNGLGILDLRSSAPATIVDNIKSFAVAKDGGPVIAYRAEPPSPSPSPAPSASPAPAVSPSPSGSPSPSPSPKADKTKETGSTLTIADLASGKRVTANDATDYAVSDNAHWVAYATETKNGKGDGFHLYDARNGTTADVLTGPGRYRDIAIARDGSSAAFLSDAATFAGDVPHDALYVVDLRAAKLAAVKAVDAGTGGLDGASTPNANGTLAFSRDGKRVFLGTAAAPTPAPSGTPDPVKVDVWTWHDDVLQSQQRHDADRERKRTYLAVYDVDAQRFAQLGAPSLRDVTRNENPNVALGTDLRPYQRAASWLGEQRRDLYAVALADGSRKLIAKAAVDGELSPGGKYALTWDESLRHWIALRTSDGKRVVLAPHAPVPFYNVEDDHPAPPPPYGSGGWLAGDRGVLLYDEYDVWLADPETGVATNLTHGAGRASQTVYSPVQPDPDADAYPIDKPILLSLIDRNNYVSGYARVAAAGGVPQTLYKAGAIVNGTRTVFNIGLHDLTMPPLSAKRADRFVFQRESFREYRDFWATDAEFHAPRKVTDANPQLATYRWGTERLISYRAADGTPLRAVMLVPDGVERNGKAPLLVSFYETMS